MKKKRDAFFLTFFTPLFFTKLLMFDVSSYILKAVAVSCFLIFIIQITVDKEYRKRELVVWIIFGSFLSLLVITCGKEGALFSLIAIVSMRKTNRIKNRYILFHVGIIGVIFCLYMARDSHEVLRYMGIWTRIVKRSNTAFISFFAVENLYLMSFGKNSIGIIILLSIVSFTIYRYTGCRTGIVCVAILLFLMFLYQYNWFKRNRFIKLLVYLTPVTCFALSIFMVLSYDKGNEIAILINDLLQGRLRQGSLFMAAYRPKLFGQKLAENFSSLNFFVLDSSYLDMYLCYGLLFTVLWLSLSTKVIMWLYSKENYIGISIVVSYAFFGISETFLPNCFLNPSILFYGDYILEKLKVQ